MGSSESPGFAHGGGQVRMVCFKDALGRRMERGYSGHESHMSPDDGTGKG